MMVTRAEDVARCVICDRAARRHSIWAVQLRKKATIIWWIALCAGGSHLQGCERDNSPQAAPASAQLTSVSPPGAPPVPRTADVTWGEPDGAKVRKWMRRHSKELRRCYESALAGNPNARGRIILRFTISETGALTGVSVTRSTFARRDVATCAVDVVRGWRTPFRPAEPVEVEYPLSFSPR